MSASAIKAGDTVQVEGVAHQDLVAAVSSDGEWVYPCGWPEQSVRRSLVTIVESCTDAEHRAFLRRHAPNSSPGPRGRWMRQNLEELPMYAWSVDQEEYSGSHDTREDAIAEALEDLDPEDLTPVWTGRVCAPDVQGYVRGAVAWWLDSEQLGEELNERAHEECGEHAGDWPVGKLFDEDLKADLTRTITAWLLKHRKPSFFTVASIVEHKVRGGQVVSP